MGMHVPEVMNVRLVERTLAVDRIELARLRLGHPHDARGAHLEARGFQVRDDLARFAGRERVRLDDGQSVIARLHRSSRESVQR
jgi:hypothetical protein